LPKLKFEVEAEVADPKVEAVEVDVLCVAASVVNLCLSALSRSDDLNSLSSERMGVVGIPRPTVDEVDEDEDEDEDEERTIIVLGLMMALLVLLPVVPLLDHSD